MRGREVVEFERLLPPYMRMKMMRAGVQKIALTLLLLRFFLLTSGQHLAIKVLEEVGYFEILRCVLRDCVLRRGQFSKFFALQLRRGRHTASTFWPHVWPLTLFVRSRRSMEAQIVPQCIFLHNESWCVMWYNGKKPVFLVSFKRQNMGNNHQHY